MRISGWAKGLRTPLGIVAVSLLVVIVATMIFAPMFLEKPATQINSLNMLQGPSSSHWLGTDALGRDVLSRTLYAARISVLLAIVTTLLATVIGIVLGATPVVVRGPVSRALVWFINLAVAFPGLLLALFLSLIFGIGAWPAVIALSIAMAPNIARLTFTTASAVAGADYVSAARLLGVNPARLVGRHIVPNIAEPLIVNSATVVGYALLSFSALSYLGFGVQSPSYDWGRMLSDGLNNIYIQPWAALAPCFAIVLTGTAFILFGELGAGAFNRSAAAVRRRGSSAVPAESRPAPASTPDQREVPVLVVENLSVDFPGLGADYRPVHDVTFQVAPGEIVGVVGESGSGKSLMASAVSALLPSNAVVSADRLELAGEDIRDPRTRAERRFLGTSLAMVFQDPMSALNPAVRVGKQLAEVSTVHQGMRRGEAWNKAVTRLDAVKIPAPERRARQYPSEFSGGMRQRAMIAMGLMGQPKLIVADEPTTALDVTVQREILALIRKAAAETGAGVLFISHDIGVISEIASRVLVMYAGRIVEDLPLSELAHGEAHPYTRALVSSVPDMKTDRHLPLATINGRPPKPGDAATGCAFATRCPFADAKCLAERPPLVEFDRDRRVACWHPQHDSSSSSDSPAESLNDDSSDSVLEVR
jgi:oligopeptide/dipeptide ABC transporter ATP-binding protein